MDGKGRCMDNIFVERLWRSLKYENVYLHAYTSVAEARAGIGDWLHFYNEERLHQAHGYRTPRQIYEEQYPWTGSAVPNGAASPGPRAKSGNGEMLTVVPRVLSKQWQGEFCRCSIDVVGGKLVASTMSSAFDTTQGESGQTNDATDC
jgi:hypothetical protein